MTLTVSLRRRVAQPSAWLATCLDPAGRSGPAYFV